MSNVHQLQFSNPVVQRDLFAHAGNKTHKFVCLDISKYDQCQLSNILVEAQITHIFDTRTFPVFRKPKFHYPQLFSFLSNNNISYSTITKDKDTKSLNSEITDFFNRCSYRGKLVSLIVMHDTLSQNNLTNLGRVRNSLNRNKSVQELYFST